MSCLVMNDRGYIKVRFVITYVVYRDGTTGRIAVRPRVVSRWDHRSERGGTTGRIAMGPRVVSR